MSAGLDADVARVDRRPASPGRQAAAMKASRRRATDGLPSGWESERTSATFGMAGEPPADLARSPRGPASERKSSRGCSIRTADGLELAHGEVAADDPARRRRSAGRGRGRRAGCSSGRVRAPMTANGASASTQTARIGPGWRTTRSATLTQKPDSGDLLQALLLEVGPLLVVRLAERPEDRPAEPVQQHRGQRQRGRAGAIARLRAIAGPVYWILAKLENQSIPRPTITVPALATRAPPTCTIASRSASVRDPAPGQLLAVAGDQEQAVVGPRAEEDDDHEDVGDVDHLEVSPGTLSAARSPSARPRPTGRSSPAGSAPAAASGRRPAG